MVSMLNQAAIDALCSAAYLESYLDCVDDLPNDLQRTVTMLRELDCVTNETMTDIRRHRETWLACETMPESASAEKKRHVASQFQRSLGRMQEIGDQKLALVSEIMENIESRIRQLDQSYDNLTNVGSLKDEDVASSVSSTVSVHTRQAASAVASSLPSAEFSATTITSPASGRLAKSEEKAEVAPVVKTGKRQKRLRNQQECITLDRDEKRVEEEEKSSTRKKKAKKERMEHQSSVTHKITAIDPNEPVYCLCQQVSYGEMIGCDNEQCSIEWFHFDCVRLTHKPKGKWFCPRCRGSRPNIMNPDLLAEQQKRSDRSSAMKRYAE